MDGLGAFDVKVVDGFVLLSTMVDSSLVRVYHKSDLSPAGYFLRIGRGPNEVLSPIFFASCQFSEYPDGPSYLFDSQSARLLGFRVKESTDACFLKTFEVDTIPYHARDVFKVGPRDFYYRRWNVNSNGLERCLIQDGSERRPLVSEVLDKVCIEKWNTSFEFNLVGSIIARKPEDSVFVEAGTYLNSINVYTLDGRFSQTICVGDRLDKVNELERKNIFDLPPKFSAVRAYKEGFCCHYLPDNQIIGFDWECEPLFIVNLPGPISSFDFDTKENALYVINEENETICRIDVPEAWSQGQ